MAIKKISIFIDVDESSDEYEDWIDSLPYQATKLLDAECTLNDELYDEDIIVVNATAKEIRALNSRHVKAAERLPHDHFREI